MKYESLVRQLGLAPVNERLAELCIHGKIEKFIIAELMLLINKNGTHYAKLEDLNRIDLVIYESKEKCSARPIALLEAKMCYSDCVSRRITRVGSGKIYEYADAIKNDRKKQIEVVKGDFSIVNMQALFVIHQKNPDVAQKYYKGFKNRETISRRELTEEEVKNEAIRFCRNDILAHCSGELAEEVFVDLSENVCLMCFFYK